MLVKARRRMWAFVAICAIGMASIAAPALAYLDCYYEITVNGTTNTTSCAQVCHMYDNTTGEYRGWIRREWQC